MSLLLAKKKVLFQETIPPATFPLLAFGSPNAGTQFDDPVISYPAGTVAGDRLFMIMQTNAQNTGGAQTGWTNIGGAAAGSGGAAGSTALVLSTRVSEGESSVALDSLGGNLLHAVILRARPDEVDVDHIIDWSLSSFGQQATATTSWSVNAVSTVVSNSMGVVMAAHAVDTTSISASFSGTGNLASPSLAINSSTNISNGGGIVVGVGQKSSPGSLGSLSFTGPSSRYAHASLAIFSRMP